MTDPHDEGWGLSFTDIAWLVLLATGIATCGGIIGVVLAAVFHQ